MHLRDLMRFPGVTVAAPLQFLIYHAFNSLLKVHLGVCCVESLLTDKSNADFFHVHVYYTERF